MKMKHRRPITPGCIHEIKIKAGNGNNNISLLPYMERQECETTIFLFYHIWKDKNVGGRAKVKR